MCVTTSLSLSHMKPLFSPERAGAVAWTFRHNEKTISELKAKSWIPLISTSLHLEKKP